MAKIGRNEPCPCGSGKKYKHCCMAKAPAEPQVLLPVTKGPAIPTQSNRGPADMPERPTAEATPAVRPAEEPRAESEEARQARAAQELEDQKWSRFWADYAEATLEQQIAMYRGELAAGDMDGSFALELLETVIEGLQKRRAFGRVMEILDELQARAPAAYEEVAPYLTRWRIRTILLSGEGDLVEPLEYFAAKPDADVDIYNHVIRRLMYHGRTRELLCAMRKGMPAVKRSKEIVPWGIEEFEAECAQLALFAHLDEHPDAEIEDLQTPELTQFFGEKRLRTIAGHLLGKAAFECTAERLALTRDEKGLEEHLFLLSLDFMRHLRTVWGWPWSRAVLARHSLLRFLRRHREQAKERMRGKKAERLDARDRSSLLFVPSEAVTFAMQEADIFASGAHQGAAFWTALARFARYAADLDLVRPEAMDERAAELARATERVAATIEWLVVDPPMLAHVREAWTPWTQPERAV